MRSKGRDCDKVWLRQSSRSKEDHHLHLTLVQASSVARPHVSDDKTDLLVGMRDAKPYRGEGSVSPALRVWGENSGVNQMTLIRLDHGNTRAIPRRRPSIWDIADFGAWRGRGLACVHPLPHFCPRGRAVQPRVTTLSENRGVRLRVDSMTLGRLTEHHALYRCITAARTTMFG